MGKIQSVKWGWGKTRVKWGPGWVRVKPSENPGKAGNISKTATWLGWAYLTKKMPHAATMPIVTAVVCFLSTQNMGS
jgi:hypothetical protein